MSKLNLTLGASLYFVPSYHTRVKGRVVTVDSVGRKWATLSNGYRVSLETGEFEPQNHGYSNPGVLYESESAFLVEDALTRAWSSLVRDLQVAKRPEGISLEVIGRVREALGLRSPGEVSNAG